jgi:hypothetical protein
MEICFRSTSICPSVITLTYPSGSPPPLLSSPSAEAAALALSPHSMAPADRYRTGTRDWELGKSLLYSGMELCKEGNPLDSGIELRKEGDRPVRQAASWRRRTRTRVHAATRRKGMVWQGGRCAAELGAGAGRLERERRSRQGSKRGDESGAGAAALRLGSGSSAVVCIVQSSLTCGPGPMCQRPGVTAEDPDPCGCGCGCGRACAPATSGRRESRQKTKYGCGQAKGRLPRVTA